MYTKVRLTLIDEDRDSRVTSTLLYTQEDLELIRLMDGKTITIFDYYEEDEKADLYIDSKHMECEELSQSEANILIEHVGYTISGEDPMEHIEPLDMFPQVYVDMLGNRIFDIFGDELLDKMDAIVGKYSERVNESTGRFYGDAYVDTLLQNIIPIKTVAQWDNQIRTAGGVDSLSKEDIEEFDRMLRNLVEDKGFPDESGSIW